MVLTGHSSAWAFVSLMRRLIKQIPERLHLVIIGRLVQSYRGSKRLRLIPSPGYRLALNPDGKNRPRAKGEMVATMRSHLYRRRQQPDVISTLHRERYARYAA